MRYSSQIEPISDLEANAAQKGEAEAVLQDVASCEETQETLALLKILSLGNQQVGQCKLEPVAEVVRRLRGRDMQSLLARRLLSAKTPTRDQTSSD